MNLERDREGKKLLLYQKKYIHRLQERFGTRDCTKAVTTPLSSLSEKEVNPEEELIQWGSKEQALKAYQSRVGSVMYPVSCTRVDGAHAASFLGQNVLQPEGRKWKEMQRTITYLQQRGEEGLLYEGGEEAMDFSPPFLLPRLHLPTHSPFTCHSTLSSTPCSSYVASPLPSIHTPRTPPYPLILSPSSLYRPHRCDSTPHFTPLMLPPPPCTTRSSSSLSSSSSSPFPAPSPSQIPTPTLALNPNSSSSPLLRLLSGNPLQQPPLLPHFFPPLPIPHPPLSPHLSRQHHQSFQAAHSLLPHLAPIFSHVAAFTCTRPPSHPPPRSPQLPHSRPPFAPFLALALLFLPRALPPFPLSRTSPPLRLPILPSSALQLPLMLSAIIVEITRF
ncbi:unnamed protein product [Closterium sp. NIES-64]|nr:unnamed protein product [Closterium sp. NIES-64]